MRRVTCICAYHGTQIYNLSAMTRDGHYITLIHYHETEKIKPYEYSTWNKLYADILNILKHNDFYCIYHESFNRRFYEIVFYDIMNPTVHEQFGFNPYLGD